MSCPETYFKCRYRTLIWFFISLPLSLAPSSQSICQTNLFAPIFTDNIQKHVKTLACDSLEGRGTGSRGAKLAADYIARQLHQSGVKAFGDRRTYFQNIPMHSSKALPSSMLKLYSSGIEQKFELNADYLLYDSGAQTFIALPQKMVFVGYGIVAPEYDYNDYQEIDIAGKIAVFLSGEPVADQDDYFAGAQNTIHSNADVKRRVALSRGALATIMIPNPRTDKLIPWEYWQKQFAFDNVSLLYARSANLNILLHPAAAADLFKGSAFEFHHIVDMENADLIQSFKMTGEVSFAGVFQEREFNDRNVIGIIPGRDKFLKDEYVLISAHYDHLGIGPAVAGDSIYNGFADNAIGVSATIEIARSLQNAPVSPKRSIVFLFTTGEEKGLLGATYYVDHPRVPLYKTFAAVNIDGIAMFDTFDDFVGIGAQYSTMENVLKLLADEFSLKYASVPTMFANSNIFGRSDQIAFAKEGIPAVALLEGFNYRNTPPEHGIKRFIEWGEKRYHTPFDDLNQPINYAAVEQHCQLLLGLISNLANKVKTVQFHHYSPFIIARLQSIAEKR
ncbi:MAG: M20/M25/M40 family metallo-hydrolase [Calditrichaeota bacterium]|nr:MAG: M20/M25/M40 family metallo-hydrolase [Calditrichota bacterium]